MRKSVKEQVYFRSILVVNQQSNRAESSTNSDDEDYIEVLIQLEKSVKNRNVSHPCYILNYFIYQLLHLSH